MSLAGGLATAPETLALATRGAGGGTLARGRLTPFDKWVLGLLLGFTALLMVGRMPWSPTAELFARSLSLTSLPHAAVERVSYVLFVPFAALAVVLFRLTLGIRLLGPFRSILVAIAFQITGITLGLVFLALVIGAIVLIRPQLKRMGLPYFGRVSALLGAVAGVMVAAVLAASWLGLGELQRVAYFPVVVLCLAGDRFAVKLRKEGPVPALWRVGATAFVAVVVAAAASMPGFGRLLLNFPELLLLQVVWIILVSEYFDLRLLQHLNPAITRRTSAHGGAGAPAAARPQPAALKIAVVRNGAGAGAGPGAAGIDGEDVARRVAAALSSEGHAVEVFEADPALPERLRGFFGTDAREGI